MEVVENLKYWISFLLIFFVRVEMVGIEMGMRFIKCKFWKKEGVIKFKMVKVCEFLVWYGFWLWVEYILVWKVMKY